MVVWKAIKGYEGLYEVSNTGLVRRLPSGRPLRTELAHKYLRVTLCKNCKTKHFSVHRLVACAFIENKSELLF